ncbi:MAG: leucyl/phenylalanyl-tRNA--protein transferase [Flavobacteriales bacterium]|nr:leucyl/phenylalanyl-tRNA--protein transferase [Flavobacteriales bacterium]
MPLFLLTDDLFFPAPQDSMPDGLIAVGGDLSEARLLLAYENGIFPWFNAGDPILWWSPNPRCFLFHEALKVSKSMRNVMNRGHFTVTMDRAFDEVIRACGDIPRKDQDGSWITDEMLNAYINLHEIGIAHSVEVWQNQELVGGLYGLSMGKIFFGESMFSKASNSSKMALISLSRFLSEKGFSGIDCQVMNEHLRSMGAEDIPRNQYLEILEKSLNHPTLKGSWSDIYEQ